MSLPSLFHSDNAPKFCVTPRQSLRFTLTSPSVITAHLAQTISTVHSLGHLRQFLVYEVNRCILQHIVEVGEDACREKDKPSWFSDHFQAKCVGAWEGTVMYVSLPYLLVVLWLMKSPCTGISLSLLMIAGILGASWH